jgi:hypothetical protein
MFQDRKRGKLHKLWSSERFLSKLSSRLRKSEDMMTIERSFYETLHALWLKDLASRPDSQAYIQSMKGTSSTSEKAQNN